MPKPRIANKNSGSHTGLARAVQNGPYSYTITIFGSMVMTIRHGRYRTIVRANPNRGKRFMITQKIWTTEPKERTETHAQTKNNRHT